MAILKSKSMVFLETALLALLAAAVETPRTVVTTAEDIVNPDDGVVSLREAVAAAENGATAAEGRHLITFAIPGDANPVIAPQSPIVVTNAALFTAGSPLEIDCVNGGRRVTFDGQNEIQLFQVFNGAGVALSNCVIENGLGELGGGITTDGPLTLNKVRFSSCTAQFMGGAVCGFDVQAENCVFVNCEAEVAGGAVYVDYDNGMASVFTAVNCLFLGNQTGVEGSGGAVHVRAGGDVLIDGATIFENLAEDGGAVYLGPYSLAQIKNSTFMNNVCQWGYGGIVKVEGADLSLVHVTSWDNVCLEGDPILVANYAGEAEVRASLIGEGRAPSELSDTIQTDSVTVWGAAANCFVCQQEAPATYCLAVGGVAQHFLKPSALAVFTGQAGDQFDQLGSERVSSSPTLGAVDYSAVPSSGTQVAVPGSIFAWATPGGGDWTYGLNWNQWSPPNGSDIQLVFGDVGGPATVSLDGNLTVGSLTFANPAGYTLAGGEFILAPNGAERPSIRVESGTQVIASAVSTTDGDGVSISCAPGSMLIFDGQINVPLALTDANVRFGEHAQINATVTCPNGFTGTGTLVMDGNGTLEVDGGFDKDYSFSGTIDARGGEVRLGRQGLPNATVELGADATLSTFPVPNGMTGRFYSLQSENWGTTDDERKNYYNNHGIEAYVNDLATFQNYVATCPGVTNFFFATDGLAFNDRNAPSEFPQDCRSGSCPNFWAAVFRGTLTVPANGTFTFRAKADDAFVLAIDGVKCGSEVKCAEATFEVNLTEGPHSFYLGILECTGDANFYLDVKMPGETEYRRAPVEWFTDAFDHGLMATFRHLPSADANQTSFHNVVDKKVHNLAEFKNYMEICPVVTNFFYTTDGVVFEDGKGPDAFPPICKGGGAYDDYWMAVFDGTITIPASGWYNFRSKADDAFVLAIDGVACLAGRENKEFAGGAYLEKGPHSFFLGMLECTGGASYFLTVQAPGDADYRYLPVDWLLPRTAVKNISGTGTLAPAAGTVLTVNRDSDEPPTFAGTLAGAAGSVLAKTGAGGMTITRRTGGDLLLEGGSLAVTAQNGVFGAVASAAGADLISLAGATSIVNLYGPAGMVFGNASDPAGEVNLAPAAETRSVFTGDMTGPATVTVAGPGTQVLGGTVALDHPLVVAGPLVLANGGHVESGVDLRSGASLEMRGGSSVGALTGTAPIALAYGDPRPYGALRDDGTFAPLDAFHIQHFTGDADSGVSPSKKYLFAFNYCSNQSFYELDVVNEVPFRRSHPTSNMTDLNEHAFDPLSGCTIVGVPASPHAVGAEGYIGLPNTQAIYNMFPEFTYAIRQDNQRLPMTLSGLTPGNAYELRLYERPYGKTDRPVKFEFDPAGSTNAEVMINQTINIDSTAFLGKDEYNNDIIHPYTIGFRFTAASPTYTLFWTSTSSADTWHLYGASLEQYDPAANVRTFDLAQSVTFAGAVSGIGEVAKTGAGTLTLTGPVDAQGFWSVKGGGLRLSSLSQVLGSVAVENGTFGGSCEVKGDLGVASSAKLLLSNVLKVDGKLAIGEGATVIAEGTGWAHSDTMVLPSVLSIRASGRETTDVTVLFSGSQDLSGVDVSRWTVYNRAGTAIDYSGWVMKSADNKSILLKTSLSPAGGDDEITNSELVENCDLEKVNEWVENLGLDVEAVNASPYALASFLMNTPLQTADPELAITTIAQNESGNWTVKVRATATYGGAVHDVPLGQGSTPTINGKLTVSVGSSASGPWTTQTYAPANLAFDGDGNATITVTATTGNYFKAVITP